jgi:hypothetical protein
VGFSLISLAWVLTGNAIVLTLARVVPLFGRLVDHTAFAAVMLRLIREGKLQRAKFLTGALPNVPIGVGMGAVLDVAMTLSPRTSEPDARTVLAAKFDASFAPIAAKVRQGILITVGAVANGGAAAVIGIVWQPVPWAMATAWVCIALALGWAEWKADALVKHGPRIFSERLLGPLIEKVCPPADTYRSAPSDPTTTAAPAPPPRAPLGSDELSVLVTRAGAAPREVILRETVIRVGTLKTAPLCLEGDPAVSRMHAVIERTDDGVVIIDLGSSSGTIFDGERINKRKLEHGDTITLGQTKLTFGIGAHAPGGEAAPPAAPETDDPRTWRYDALHVYGFDARSPDLFYEIVGEIVRSAPNAKGVRLAKLRRKAGEPTFVVALLGVEDGVRAACDAIETNAESRYRKCATPAAAIAPDATYGRETSKGALLRDELARGEAEVLDCVRA